MSKKLYLLFLNMVFLSVNLNLNAMAADEDFIALYESQATEEPGNQSDVFEEHPYLRQPLRPVIRASRDIVQPGSVPGQAIVEKVLSNIEKMNTLEVLLEKYGNDLVLVKNDPIFDEIKPILKEMYEMISSIPFFISIPTDGIDMFKAQIEENLAKKSIIKGFEELNEDVKELMDNTFSYADKFIEFLRKFSKHFVENKIIKELLAD